MNTSRALVADAASLIIFSTVIGAMVELVTAGLTVEQTIGTRLSALPIILFAGRLYGIYRDWVFRVLHVCEEDQLKATLADTIANVSFQTPLYVILLVLNGATPRQMVFAAGSVILNSTVSGRPYGIFMMWIRRLFGLLGKI